MSKKGKKKPKFKPVKREPADFVYNTEWTEIFGQEDDDQPEPIYGEMTNAIRD